MNPLQATPPRPEDVDAFVTKVAPAGNSFAYSTRLGGSNDDHGLDVGTDLGGNAYVTGDTRSPGFPTARPLQAGAGGTASGVGGSFADAFVSKLDPAGTDLVYSTFLGGSDTDQGTAIAVDGDGAVYVTGNTNSPNFPTASPVQGRKDADTDAFVSKINPAGAALVYSTYLGGGGADGGTAIAVDRGGNATVVGSTASSNFPTARPVQGVKGGGVTDAFLSTLVSSGATLATSTYVGGTGRRHRRRRRHDRQHPDRGRLHQLGRLPLRQPPAAGPVGHRRRRLRDPHVPGRGRPTPPPRPPPPSAAPAATSGGSASSWPPPPRCSSSPSCRPPTSAAGRRRARADGDAGHGDARLRRPRSGAAACTSSTTGHGDDVFAGPRPRTATPTSIPTPPRRPRCGHPFPPRRFPPADGPPPPAASTLAVPDLLEEWAGSDTMSSAGAGLAGGAGAVRPAAAPGPAGGPVLLGPLPRGPAPVDAVGRPRGRRVGDPRQHRGRAHRAAPGAPPDRGAGRGGGSRRRARGTGTALGRRHPAHRPPGRRPRRHAGTGQPVRGQAAVEPAKRPATARARNGAEADGRRHRRAGRRPGTTPPSRRRRPPRRRPPSTSTAITSTGTATAMAMATTTTRRASAGATTGGGSGGVVGPAPQASPQPAQRPAQATHDRLRPAFRPEGGMSHRRGNVDTGTLNFATR